MSTAASLNPAQAERPTRDAHAAYPAAAVSAVEAPLTAATDRYLRAAAHAVARDALRLLRRTRPGRPGSHVTGSRVLLLVGGGHNGADTLLAGADLARRGCVVRVALATDLPHAMAWDEALAAGVRPEPDPPVPGPGGPCPGAPPVLVGDLPDLVVDGLTGIGATGPLRPRAADLVRPLVAAGRPGVRPFAVLAVDVPSGTGVDDGTVAGPVLAADRTVTFTCLKGCLALPPARHLAGEVGVVDLGLPVPDHVPLVRRPDATALARHLPVPGPADHKYTRGVLTVWAGSDTYPGAAVLTCSAAARTGAGMVRLVAPRRVEDLVLAARPEVVPTDGRSQALVLGPGTDPADGDRASQVRTALALALDEAAAAVVDAGALGLLPSVLAEGHGGGRASACQVLTPHAGEAAGLLTALTGRSVARDAVEAAPGAHARDLARATGATVLLKGATTVIATPDGALTCVDSGPSWMATAGSGDVLAGILGALLAGGQARAEREAEGAAPGAARGPDLVGSHDPGPGGKAGPASGGAMGAGRVAALAALAVRLHAGAGHRASRWASSRWVSGQVVADVGASHPVVAGDLVDALPGALADALDLSGGPSPSCRSSSSPGAPDLTRVPGRGRGRRARSR